MVCLPASLVSSFYFARRGIENVAHYQATTRAGYGHRQCYCHSCQPRNSDTSAAPGFELIVDVRHVSRSFAERRLDSEPHSHDKPVTMTVMTALKGIALCLLDAPTPAPQVLKIRAKLVSFSKPRVVKMGQ